MPNSPNKLTITLQLDKTDKEKFDKQFPGLLKLFLQRAINKSINDRTLFETIFFLEV